MWALRRVYFIADQLFGDPVRVHDQIALEYVQGRPVVRPPLYSPRSEDASNDGKDNGAYEAEIKSNERRIE